MIDTKIKIIFSKKKKCRLNKKQKRKAYTFENGLNLTPSLPSENWVT
jgi:hypothetical protein